MVNTTATAATSTSRLPPRTNPEPVNNKNNNKNNKKNNNSSQNKTSSSTAATAATRTKLVLPALGHRRRSAHEDDDDDHISISSAVSIQSQRDVIEKELLQLRQKHPVSRGGLKALLHHGQSPPTGSSSYDEDDDENDISVQSQRDAKQNELRQLRQQRAAAASGGLSALLTVHSLPPTTTSNLLSKGAAAPSQQQQHSRQQQQQQQSRGTIAMAAVAASKKNINVVNPYFRRASDDDDDEDDGMEQDLESLLLFSSPNSSPKSGTTPISFQGGGGGGRGNPEKQQQQKRSGGGGLHLLSSLPSAPGLTSVHTHHSLEESIYFSCHGSHASKLSLLSGDHNSSVISTDTAATNDHHCPTIAATGVPKQQEQEHQHQQASFSEGTLHHSNLSPGSLERKLPNLINSNTAISSTGMTTTITTPIAVATSTAADITEASAASNNDRQSQAVGKRHDAAIVEKAQLPPSLSEKCTFPNDGIKAGKGHDAVVVVQKAPQEQETLSLGNKFTSQNCAKSQAIGERQDAVVGKERRPRPPSLSLSENCKEAPAVDSNKATTNVGLQLTAAADKMLAGRLPARHETLKASQRQLLSPATEAVLSQDVIHKTPSATNHSAIDPKLIATPTATAKPAAASRLELMQQARSLSGSVRNMKAMFEHSSSNQGTATNASNTGHAVSTGSFYLEKEHADCKKKNSLLLPPQLLHAEPPTWKKQQLQQQQQKPKQEQQKKLATQLQQTQADPALATAAAAANRAALLLALPRPNLVPPQTAAARTVQENEKRSMEPKQNDATKSGATGTELLHEIQTMATLPSQHQEEEYGEPETNMLTSTSLQAEGTWFTTPLHFQNKLSSATLLQTPTPVTFSTDDVSEAESMQQKMMHSKLKSAVELSSTTSTAMPFTPGSPASPDAPRISVLLSSFSPDRKVQMQFPASPSDNVVQRGGNVATFVSAPPMGMSKPVSPKNLPAQAQEKLVSSEIGQQPELEDERKYPATPLQPQPSSPSPAPKQSQSKVAPKKTVKALFQWRAANVKQGAPCPPKQRPIYDEDSDYEYVSYHSDSPDTPVAPDTQGLPEKSYVSTPSEYAQAQLGLPNVCKSKYSRQLKLASMPALVDDNCAVPVGQRKYAKTPIDYARAQLGLSSVCKSKYEQQLKLAQLATSGSDDDDETIDTGVNDADVDGNEVDEDEVADNDDDIVDLERDMDLFESDEEYILDATETEFIEESERNDDLHHNSFESMDSAKENPTELTCLINNILRRERAIQEGYITTDQVKTIMELPVEELMIILNYLEPDNGKAVDWEALADMIPIIVEETAHESGDDDDEDENADLDSTNRWSTHNITGDPCAMDVDFGDGYSLQADSTRCDSSVTCTDDEIIEEIVYTDTEYTAPKDGDDR